MKKSRLKWTIMDGEMPSQREVDGCWELKAPMPLQIPPNGKTTLKLGVRCSHALHAIPAWENERKGLKLVDGVWAAQDADPDRELVVHLHNTSNETVLVETGEVVARCVVFGA